MARQILASSSSTTSSGACPLNTGVFSRFMKEKSFEESKKNRFARDGKRSAAFFFRYVRYCESAARSVSVGGDLPDFPPEFAEIKTIRDEVLMDIYNVNHRDVVKSWYSNLKERGVWVRTNGVVRIVEGHYVKAGFIRGIYLAGINGAFYRDEEWRVKMRHDLSPLGFIDMTLIVNAHRTVTNPTAARLACIANATLLAISPFIQKESPLGRLEVLHSRLHEVVREEAIVELAEVDDMFRPPPFAKDSSIDVTWNDFCAVLSERQGGENIAMCQEDCVWLGETTEAKNESIEIDEDMDFILDWVVIEEVGRSFSSF